MPADLHSAIFFKTAKALEELSDRRHGLRAKARQLLVLLDGKRTVSDLASLIAQQDLLILIEELQREGFISQTQAATPAPTQTEPISPEATIDPVSLARAKAYLIEISQQHLGLMAAKLQQEIATASDHASVRAALAHWNMALRESRSGAGIATPCLQKARDSLGYTN